MNLRSYLMQRRPLTLRAVKTAIDRGFVRVNGRVVRISTQKIAPTDHVDCDWKKLEEYAIPPSKVLFENNDMMAFDKPFGVESVAFILRAKALPVHRLDKDTSGVLLAAKNTKTQQWLEEQFRKRLVQKYYIAIVRGKAEALPSTLHDFLPKGGEAITHVQILGYEKGQSILLCQPETGRTHQIRLQLARRGHPVVGDLEYGTTAKSALRQQLHAVFVRVGGVDIVSPLPEDMLKNCPFCAKLSVHENSFYQDKCARGYRSVL